MSKPEGRWITANGRHVFIPKGVKAADAISAHFRTRRDREQKVKREKVRRAHLERHAAYDKELGPAKRERTVAAWDNGMSQEEYDALHLWVAQGHSTKIKAFQSGSEGQYADSHAEAAYWLGRLIARAPVYKGEAYRGVVLANVPAVGERMVHGSVSSFTSSESVAAKFASGHGGNGKSGTPAVFVLGKRKALADVSSVVRAMPGARLGMAMGAEDESELLSPKGAKYRVTKIVKGKGTLRIHVDEV
jgi:hypothetical protein